VNTTPPVLGLSLTQPWATLVAIGQKKIETRSWGTKYRGLIAIHASKGFPASARVLCSPHISGAANPFYKPLFDAGYPFTTYLPLGAIIAVATVLDVGQIYRLHEETRITGQEFTVQGDELAFGDYTPGRYGWVLTNVHALKEPVPCRGALSLWPVPTDVWQRVAAQLPVQP